MTKSKEIIESINDEELKILVMAFSKPKVIEAMRIYNTLPGFMKSTFIKLGQIELEKRAIITPPLGITAPGICKVCGCTDGDCSQCINAQGFPCHWVEDDLCSRCDTHSTRNKG